MKAYKLVRLKRNGEIGSLFIKRSDDLKIGEWLEAELNPTKGFAERYGWHCTYEMNAPHLKMNLANGEKRVWVEVEVKDFKTYKRPESQGGAWILAKHMKIIKKI